MGFHYTPTAFATQFFDGYACGVARLTALALLLAACTPAQVPLGKTVFEIMALGGVGGMMATGVVAHATDANLAPLEVAFSVSSAVGIIGWAILELQFDQGPAPETLVETHHRWARILTQRAAGAARENQCKRVKHIETRVRVYDSEFHDFVFMRDQEIVRCLQEP